MKKHFFLFSLLMSLTIGTVSVCAEEASIIFSKQELENGVQYLYPFVLDDNISVIFSGTGGLNDGKYYDAESAIRVYENGQMTVFANAGFITDIELTYGSGDSNTPITTNIGTFVDSIWTGYADFVEFSVDSSDHSSDYRSIAAVKVTYNLVDDPIDSTPWLSLKQWGQEVTMLEVGSINVTNQIIELVPSNFKDSIPSVCATSLLPPSK